MKYQMPLYMQLKDSLAKRIEAKEFLPGETLPSERMMAQEFDVNRETIKKAIALLEKDGLVTSIQGKGTVVTKQSRKIYEESVSSRHNVGISSKLKLQGITASNKLLVNEVVKGLKRVNKKLKIKETDSVLALHRVRYADGIPFSIEYAYFPFDIMNEDYNKYDYSQVSFYDYLSQIGHLPVEFRRKLTIVCSPSREANYLEIEEGTPIYLFEDIGRDSEGRVVEFIRTYSRTDQVQLSFNSYKE